MYIVIITAKYFILIIIRKLLQGKIREHWNKYAGLLNEKNFNFS